MLLTESTVKLELLIVKPVLDRALLSIIIGTRPELDLMNQGTAAATAAAPTLALNSNTALSVLLIAVEILST